MIFPVIKMGKNGLIMILLIMLVFACGLVFTAWNMDEQYMKIQPDIAVNAQPATEPVTNQVNEEQSTEVVETKEDEFIVCIDPGHGGSDTGAGDPGAYEKDQVLEVALMVRAYLEEQNIKVIMTRTRDCTNDLDERIAFANENYADVMVSIHRNFYEGFETTNGIECWIRHDRPQTGADLADMVMNRLAEVGKMDIRGIRSGSADSLEEDFRINRDCQMPSMILELGYMSDKSDNAAFVNYKEKYAQAIALGIMDFMEKYGEENLNG